MRKDTLVHHLKKNTSFSEMRTVQKKYQTLTKTCHTLATTKKFLQNDVILLQQNKKYQTFTKHVILLQKQVNTLTKHTLAIHAILLKNEFLSNTHAKNVNTAIKRDNDIKESFLFATDILRRIFVPTVQKNAKKRAKDSDFIWLTSFFKVKSKIPFKVTKQTNKRKYLLKDYETKKTKMHHMQEKEEFEAKENEKKNFQPQVGI